MPPLALSIIIISGILLIFLPRPYVVIPWIIPITLIPLRASIDIGPATFAAPQLMVLFGFARLICKKEETKPTFNKTDLMVILWSISMIITGALQPKIDTGLLFRIGETYDIFGMYFISRFLIRSEDDLKMVFKTVAWVFAILAAAMIYEKLKRYNVFSLLGGNIYIVIRNGKIRCQGAFNNYILAGTVGATSCAWFLTLWKTQSRKMAYLGVISSILITFLSASSGPIMSLISLLVGLFAWPFRNNMKSIRIGIILSLILLQLFMKAPIWFLIGRIDLTGSSTGWHRAELIDSAIRHLDEWWLIGTVYTRHWMPTGVTWSPNHTDITNQYIKNGVWGGLTTMFLFIFIISSSFGAIGRKIKEIGDGNRKHQMLLWVFGSSLFSHMITFISVRYFDQSVFYFYLLLAMIGYATEEKTLIPS